MVNGYQIEKADVPNRYRLFVVIDNGRELLGTLIMCKEDAEMICDALEMRNKIRMRSPDLAQILKNAAMRESAL